MLSSQTSRPEPAAGTVVTANCQRSAWPPWQFLPTGKESKEGSWCSRTSQKAEVRFAVASYPESGTAHEQRASIWDGYTQCQPSGSQHLLRKCNFSLRCSVSERSWAVRPLLSMSPVPSLCWDLNFSHLSRCVTKDAASYLDGKEERRQRAQLASACGPKFKMISLGPCHLIRIQPRHI